MRAETNGTLNLDGLLPLMQGAPVGLVAAAAMGATGLQHAAAALAAGAAAVAVKMAVDRRRERRADSVLPSADWLDMRLPQESARPALSRKPDLPTLIAAIDSVMDVPEIDEDFKARIKAAGAVAQFRSGNWLVFEADETIPRVMNDREYARYRQAAPDLVQVDSTGHGVGVTRFAFGRLDGRRSGEPAIATYDRGMRRTSATWFLDGRPATPEAVEAAHAALDPFPGSPRS